MLVENLKILGVVLGTLIVFTVMANSIPQVQSEAPQDLVFGPDVTAEELVSAGEILYRGAGACAACHGLPTRAPALSGDEDGTGSIGVRCSSRVEGQDCKTYLYEAMVDPEAFLVEGYNPIMPDMRRSLSNAQIWAIVAYLQAQGGEVTVTGADIVGDAPSEASAPATAAPATPTASLDPIEILRANTCLVCHVLQGEGTPMGPAFDDVGSRLGTEDIRTSILDPQATLSPGYEAFAGVMPGMFGAQLTAEQLEVVVQFLANQR